MISAHITPSFLINFNGEATYRLSNERLAV